MCRFCHTPLKETLCTLGMSPLSNSYLRKEELQNKETFFPLHTRVCSHCFLVQLPEFESPANIFQDYAYFSSYSSSWLTHCKTYAETISNRFHLNKESLVVEIASNDGYLLQYFKEKGIPILGIEPARNVAEVAIAKGIPTEIQFFGTATAKKLNIQADLLAGNNVLAHVPDINDFVKGMKILLKKTGVITMEFPHLAKLLSHNQFDTIYHEHFSYLSFTTAEKIFHAHGLTLFDVEELPTHGGSLRIFGKHIEDQTKEVTPNVARIKKQEALEGLNDLSTYQAYGERVKATKRALLRFLIEAKEVGKQVVGYGAPAKGNTLLNYCGIREDLLPYTVDRSPHKIGKFLPGTHIPIHAPDKIRETKPDFILILPWNLKDEIMAEMAFVKEWGGQFVVPIPTVEVLPG